MGGFDGTESEWSRRNMSPPCSLHSQLLPPVDDACNDAWLVSFFFSFFFFPSTFNCFFFFYPHKNSALMKIRTALSGPAASGLENPEVTSLLSRAVSLVGNQQLLSATVYFSFHVFTMRLPRGLFPNFAGRECVGEPGWEGAGILGINDGTEMIG